MSQLNVLIAGASIAGPTAAYWFAKAGARVTVIERFAKLRTNGQNVDIRTAGVTVMRKMPGMEAAVRAKTMQLEGISFVNEDGRPYGTIRATGDPNQQSLVSEYEIFRGDLAEILFDMTKDNPNIRYVFGEQIVSMQQGKKDGPITAEFANGLLPTAEYDLVVACDGASSRTRAIGLNCGVKDHMQPTNCWVAYFSIDQDLMAGSKIGQSYSAPGGRFMAIGPDPSGVTRVTLMSIHPVGERDLTLPFREAVKQGEEATKQFIVQCFEGAGWKTKDILRGLMTAKDFYAVEVAQVKPPSLYNGRFVLVGDAGYASGFTGGGTTLAITGAYLLAGEISRHKGGLTAGLSAYEERMRPIIDDLQKIPPLMPTILAPQTAWGLWLRNHIFAFISWTRIFEYAQRFFASSFSSADRYKLRDYEWVE